MSGRIRTATAALFILVVIALGAVPGSASAAAPSATSASDRMRDCLALGGNVAACCAAVGGDLQTVIIDGKETLVCVITTTPGRVQSQATAVASATMAHA